MTLHLVNVLTDGEIFFFQEIVKEFLKILFGFPLERTYGKSQFSSSGGWGTDGSQPTR